jgi:hypothetical protein
MDEEDEEGVDCLGWNEFQRVFRGQGVLMATLKLMYHTYRRGQKVPGLEAYPEMEARLRRAEVEAGKARMAMACELYHFLMTADHATIDTDLATAAAAALRPAVMHSSNELGLSCDVTKTMSNLVNALDESKFMGWTNWNDFQRLLRGKGLSMTELQEIYVRYKRHVSTQSATSSQLFAPRVARQDGPALSAISASSPIRSSSGDDPEAWAKMVRVPDTFVQFDAAALRRRRKQLSSTEGETSSHFTPDPDYAQDESDEADNERFRVGGNGGGDREDAGHAPGSCSHLGKMRVSQRHAAGDGGDGGGGRGEKVLAARGVIVGCVPVESRHRSKNRHFLEHERRRQQNNRKKVQTQWAHAEDGSKVELSDNACCLVCLGSVSAELWVACDTCEVWQHQLCAGYLCEDDVPDKHYCDECLSLQYSLPERMAPKQRANPVPLPLSHVLEKAAKQGPGQDAQEGSAQEQPHSDIGKMRLADREVVYGRGDRLLAASRCEIDFDCLDELLPPNPPPTDPAAQGPGDPDCGKNKGVLQGVGIHTNTHESEAILASIPSAASLARTAGTVLASVASTYRLASPGASDITAPNPPAVLVALGSNEQALLQSVEDNVLALERDIALLAPASASSQEGQRPGGEEVEEQQVPLLGGPASASCGLALGSSVFEEPLMSIEVVLVQMSAQHKPDQQRSVCLR